VVRRRVDQAARLARASRSRSWDCDAPGIERLEEALQGAVERGRRALVAERRSTKEQLVQREGGEAAGWLERIDDLSLGSFDTLTITICCPV
jgi:hypothetical protein